MPSRSRLDVAEHPDITINTTLDSLESATNYRDWIVELMRPHLAAPLLEVGAGHGTFTVKLREIGAVHAVEPGERQCVELIERFRNDPSVMVTSGTIAGVDAAARYDSAVMINVLEHIADDDEALRAIAARLLPGGRLALWVPAFELLYSDFDRKLGHHRRYRKRELVDLVTGAGYQIIDVRYANAPGFFSWLVITRLLRQEPTDGPLVRVFDRFVVPVVRAVERRVRPPFGQSLLLIARTPTESG